MKIDPKLKSALSMLGYAVIFYIAFLTLPRILHIELKYLRLLGTGIFLLVLVFIMMTSKPKVNK